MCTTSPYLAGWWCASEGAEASDVLLEHSVDPFWCLGAEGHVEKRSGYHRRIMRPRETPPPAEHALEPVLDFMRLLWTIEHGLQKRSKRMEAELGITGPQRLVLRVVGQFPGLSAGEVAHIVRLHPSTMTGILRRLVARGLLQRERDPGDSRRARLRLKPRAVAHTRTVPGTIEHAVTLALRRVGAANVRAARKVLAEVADQLNQV
jgi:DNA-binding MarR family transcriptional regulator